MEINIESFDKICRVCLKQSEELKSLFSKIDGDERNLLEILSFTATVDVKIEDSLPKQVCIACEDIMCKADAFKRRCHESESILHSVYSNTNGTTQFTDCSPNYTIKEEKRNLKEKLIEYGTVLSPISAGNDSKDELNNKNIQDFPISSIADLNGSSDFSTAIEETVKKEELIDNEDDNDYLDNYDDGSNFEYVPPDSPNTQKDANNCKILVCYKCYCNSIFTSEEVYKKHLEEKNCNKPKAKINVGIEIFQCSLCLRKFKNKVSLSTHLQRHEQTDNIKHKCEICKREFKYKAYLENHMLTAHSKTNGFTCDTCMQSFLNKEALETHKKSHDLKKHECKVCRKSFRMLCTLKEHMRTHTGEKPFLCSQCGKGFSQKTNLAQHTRRHQGLRPFKCETCEKRFVSKGELDAHKRKHSGAHPFVCDDCGNGFTTSSALVKHKRIHTGERPYQCDLCPMRFAASGTLKNHRRTHTGERPFQCSYCEKAFVQRNDLIGHIRCHTGERPYICNQCGQSFRKASGLKAHVKLHIKEPVVGVNALLTSLHCNEQ